MVHVIVIEDLWKSYGRTLALSGFEMHVEEGRIHGLLGPNGAGKTTTLRSIIGLVRPDRGRITVLGEEVWVDKGYHVKKFIGYLPELPRLPEWAGVGEILERYATLYGIPVAERARRIREVLETVELEGKIGAKIGHLSKGQKQRLGIAQAIIHDPKLLILDEPMLGLDPEGMAKVRDIIRGLSRRGVTILMSTHMLREVEDLCDNVTLISGGKLLFEGSVEELRLKTAVRKSVLIELRERTDEAVKLLSTLDFVDRAERVASNRIRVFFRGDEDLRDEVVRLLVLNGFRVLEVRLLAPSLEEAFIRLVR